MPHPIIAGAPEPALAALLAAVPCASPTLVNADPLPESQAVIARSTSFAAAHPGGLIVMFIQSAPAGLQDFDRHREAATLWAFTRQAALEWAPARVRVNAIGFGTAPFGPYEADDQAGRGAANVKAVPATPADIARTLRAIVELPSMTGQIIRLGS